jgi:hypothetical protein
MQEMRTKPRVIDTTVDAIHAAETELARNFPKSFSDWLLDNNGKALSTLVVFPVFDARNPCKTWKSIVRHFEEN